MTQENLDIGRLKDNERQKVFASRILPNFQGSDREDLPFKKIAIYFWLKEGQITPDGWTEQESIVQGYRRHFLNPKYALLIVDENEFDEAIRNLSHIIIPNDMCSVECIDSWKAARRIL